MLLSLQRALPRTLLQTLAMLLGQQMRPRRRAHGNSSQANHKQLQGILCSECRTLRSARDLIWLPPVNLSPDLQEEEAAEVAALLAAENVALVPEGERDRLGPLDALTGAPLPEDVLLFALPVSIFTLAHKHICLIRDEQ